MQWTQSGMSVALRRMCVGLVNWYFLQGDSEKSWRWQKKIPRYLFMRWYKYVRRVQRQPASQTTVRQGDGWRRTAKGPWRLCRCENRQQPRWESLLVAAVAETPQTEREREAAATDGSSYQLRTYLGDALVSRIHSCFYLFIFVTF